MANFEFDFSELTKLEEKLLNLGREKMPKACNKFLRDEGTKLRKQTVAKAKNRVKKQTGNYLKSIRRGKVYVHGASGALSIRVFSNAPHKYLIEKGHRIVKNGVEVGFVPGKNVFEEAQKSFDNEFSNDVHKFIDDLLESGLR